MVTADSDALAVKASSAVLHTCSVCFDSHSFHATRKLFVTTYFQLALECDSSIDHIDSNV
jgi:hypothetical protein